MRCGTELEEEYGKLMNDFGFYTAEAQKIGYEVEKIIKEFVKGHNHIAIWGAGKHTEMMMSEYIADLKKVQTIIDKKRVTGKFKGFRCITPDKIEIEKIQSIIISSYKNRFEIAKEIQKIDGHIEILDIYHELEKRKIICDKAYYSIAHPYETYRKINELQREFRNSTETEEKKKILKEIIEKYLQIKDFWRAAEFIKQYDELTQKEESWCCQLTHRIKELLKHLAGKISRMNQENVLMLCIDGLRAKDLEAGYLPCLLETVHKKAVWFKNAYSVSTSTYESLFPVYCGSNSLKDKCYALETVEEERCAFVREAVKNHFKIQVQTDGYDMITGSHIENEHIAGTITEKLWSAVCNLDIENRTLMYIHILWESHFSYVNPLTERPLVASGMNIIFDLLEGDEPKTDYVQQQRDALKYVDSVLAFYLNKIPCEYVIFSDHGNVLEKDYGFIKKEPNKMECHQDLIKIPFIMKRLDETPQENEALISLAELPDMISSLLNRKKFLYTEPKYVKVMRSPIYNRDFQNIYMQYQLEKYLGAFEAFVFEDKKLLIMENGDREVYLLHGNEEVQIEDETLKQILYESIKGELTLEIKHGTLEAEE